MKPLETPDSHHLQAAQGWLELGNHAEANAELEKITAHLRAHPDVLAVRWLIYAKAEQWEACRNIGVALVNLAPEDPIHWLHRSCAHHRLNRTEEAADLLLPAAAKFPDDWRICYDLGCYACQLGNHEEAWDLLEDAFDLGDPKQVKLMALDDPDLEPFWAEIGEV
jgi:tetratricopeptide (TPR) repeat protein